MHINWALIKKMGKTKSIKVFKKAHPDLNFRELYEKKFPPKKEKSPKKKGENK